MINNKGETFIFSTYLGKNDTWWTLRPGPKNSNKTRPLRPVLAHKATAKNTISTNTEITAYLDNAWALFSMITEGEAAILLETTQRAFRNQSQSKQRSTYEINICKQTRRKCSSPGAPPMDDLCVMSSSLEAECQPCEIWDPSWYQDHGQATTICRPL